jgi:hypothetical protein
MHEDKGLSDAQRKLRGHRVGTLLFEDNLRPVKFVVDPASGRVVLPMMVAMVQTDHQVLMIPEETEDSLQLLLDVESIGEHEAVTDKWRIYHGEPEDIHWVSCWIDSGKLSGLVFDGDALMMPNPLAGDEPRLVGAMNARRDDVKHLCARYAGMEVEKPLCVGVDAWGMHVRSRFDVLRVELPREAESRDDFVSMIDGMLSPE